MKSVNEIIGDLLLQNSCVIIPSFGGFVAKRNPAKIDYSSGLMLPPSKSLLFNRQLVNNDGLLVNELAKERNLHFDEANRYLQEEISSWKSKLKVGERVEIDRVGRIYLDAEKNFCFEQDRFFNLLLESYGLKKIHFLTEEDVEIVEKTIEIMEAYKTPILEVSDSEEEETKSEAHTPVVVVDFVPKEVEKEDIQELRVKVQPTIKPIQTEGLSDKKEKRSKNNMWRYAVAACLLPIAFYSFWIPLKTDVLESGVITVNDFNPFYKHQVAGYREMPVNKLEIPEVSKEKLSDSLKGMPADINVYTFKYDSANYLQIDIETKVDSKLDSEVVEEQNTLIISSEALNYIVGCFGSKSNASRFVKELKKEGFDARIVGMQNGLHRVSAGAALSEEELNSIAAKAKSKGHPGWVLRD